MTLTLWGIAVTTAKIGDVCFFFIPSLFVLLFSAFYARVRYADKKAYGECMTIGQVALTVLMLFSATVPILSLFVSFFCAVALLFHFEWELRELLETPICFWRKDK